MYFIKKKSLSRRTFLRNSGICLGLPLLDAMIPAFANAASSTPPLRVAYLYFPHGTHPSLNPWHPISSGSQFTFPGGLSSTNLINYRNDLLLMGGLSNIWAQYNIYGDSGNDHAAACASYLTGARMNWKSKVAGFTLSTRNSSNGPFPFAQGHKSVDVIIADHLGGAVKIPVLQLTPPGFAAYDGGTAQYDVAYRTYLSWRSATSPTPRFETPLSAFQTLFGDGTQTTEEPTNDSVSNATLAKKSILDFVLVEANQLKKTLGALDKLKLDEYLTAVRDVEKEIQLNPAPQPNPTNNPQACQAPTQPDSDQGFAEMTKSYLDLIVLAFQCDQTRVASYLMDYELNSRSYSFAGANHYDGHQASHGGFSNNYGDAFKITNWYANQFAYFVNKLKTTSDVHGPLLDNAIVHLGSGTNTTGGDHPDDELPMVVAGRGGGLISTGRALHAGNSRLENYHLSLMKKIGVPINQFGGSTGTIAGL